MSSTDARTELELSTSAGATRDIYKTAYLSANPRRTGTERISAERVRQVVGKGWTPEHDGTEHEGETGRAEDIIVGTASWVGKLADHAVEKYKGQDRYRLLEIAAALIAAELDRLDGGVS